MIKLFASDLDGTLFNALHQTDGAILRRLRRVLAAGRRVALATGRWSKTGAELGFGDLPLEVVCGNGAFVYGAGGELLRSVEIDPATVEELLRAFPTCCLVCVSTDGTFVRGSREDQLAGYLPPSGAMGRLVLDPGLKAELAAFVDDHADTLVNASFDGDLFELTEASVDKGEALAWLAGHLGMTEDEVAVYGDGGNDIAMLERFDHAYATSNASDEAKRAAGNVIGSCAQHAVPRHMLATVRREGALG